jgi:hypothetical protein
VVHGIVITSMGEKNEVNKAKAIEQVRSVIRPELNIEKHADFIFAPAHSNRLNRPRKKMWTIYLNNGDKAASYLLIKPPYGDKTPTTKTRKVYLALTKLWEERRREDDAVVFSAREIADILGIKWAGKKTASEIYHEIQSLRTCIFTWQYSFFDASGSEVELLEHMNILDKFAYVRMKERKQKGEYFQALHIVRFSDHILTNLKANRTKPTLLQTILSIKGEVAAVLYARLDIILSDKDQYARTTKGLFEDLHLDNDVKYRYPSGRRQILEKAIKEINGKNISTGTLNLCLEKTIDGADWKLMARRVALFPIIKKSIDKKKLVPANPPELIPVLAQDIGAVIGDYQNKRRLYETYTLYYSAPLIHRSISEYKADIKDPKYPGRAFSAILHRLAHKTGKEWIRPCGSDCKYRP